MKTTALYSGKFKRPKTAVINKIKCQPNTPLLGFAMREFQFKLINSKHKLLKFEIVMNNF
jgi:hypothetical protein